MLPPNEYVVSVQSADMMRTAFHYHIVQIVFSSFTVVPAGNFRTTGEMDTSPARDIEIPVLNFVNPTLTNPKLTLN